MLFGASIAGDVGVVGCKVWVTDSETPWGDGCMDNCGEGFCCGICDGVTGILNKALLELDAYIWDEYVGGTVGDVCCKGPGLL